ncbi:bifunctional (p)ppGpp synthetase/guanosine-3',5'-bis(diphosphate) 3'-pyrophosphohydrolase [Candidatus Peregrinibacteria bacterium]|nr:bifunctional (p)ppGpp synthetase/guanosine-3',5'-bis(diphosphate) 3'-pyrophosphohydrolase [Candidatus Peregrinibacteria bacterium]
MMVENVLAKIKEFIEKPDEQKIKDGFGLAKENGFDPRRILDVLLPFEPDMETLIVAILYPMYLDDLLSDAQIRKDFGTEVFTMLQNAKKLKRLNYAENDRSSQLEILKKMFLVMAKDVRVILIILAYRLVLMNNLKDFVPKDRQQFFAKETMELYVPIADRMGMHRLKTQLEDLAFFYCQRDDYEKIEKQLNKVRLRCRTSIAKIKEILDKFFVSKRLKVEVSGRIKGIYSIYKKFQRKGLNHVDELFDIFAMRVVLLPKYGPKGEVLLDHLYAVLGLLHSEWRPLSRRFKDYIAVPKPNGYKSLHTVVLGLAPKNMDQPIEIQIRDEDMHRDAEYGVAAHWLYKGKRNAKMEMQMDWLKNLEKLYQDEDGNFDLFKDRIFVLTPRGEVKDLPNLSCPIDFAYSVHTDVGHRCVMSKVDGKIVPLNYELKNGEVVEIVTRKDAIPKLQWLSLVKTGFAKNKIRAYFSALNKENNIKEGKRLLNNQLMRLNKPPLDQNYSILRDYLGRRLTLTEREGLVEEIGKGGKMVSDVIRKIYPYEELVLANYTAPNLQQIPAEDASSMMKLEDQILIGGEGGLPVKLAFCCKPEKHCNIVGYVTRGNTISMHRADCKILDALNVERLVFAQWKFGSKKDADKKYVLGIKLIVAPRIGLIHDVTSIISGLGIMIRDLLIKNLKGGLNENFYLLELNSLDQFDRLMDRLEVVSGVLKVSRDERFKSREA